MELGEYKISQISERFYGKVMKDKGDSPMDKSIDQSPFA
jgi:hypothetical protein